HPLGASTTPTIQPSIRLRTPNHANEHQSNTSFRFYPSQGYACSGMVPTKATLIGNMRVLIATVTAGAGHLAAAAALDEAWRALRPADAVERLDLVKFSSPLHRKIVSYGYVKLVEHAPELWGMMFKKSDDPKL